MSLQARDRIRARRRMLGFAGLIVGCVAVAEAKSATAPATHRITLGAGRAASQPAPQPNGASQHVPSRASATGARTVTGQAFDVGYGIVQVRVVFSGNRIVDIVPVQMPSGGRSSEITSFAVPQLKHEVLDAQSTQIDSVSGASYTSYGYAKSVQSALDASGR